MLAPVQHVKTIMTPATDPIHKEYSALFRKSTAYFNYSDEEIVTLDRNNFPVVHQKSPSPYGSHRGFVITTTYHFVGRQITVDSLIRMDSFAKRFKIIDPHHNVLRAMLQKSFDQNPNSAGHVISVHRVFTIEQLKRYQVLYEQDVDLLITVGSGWLGAAHPYSIEGRSTTDHSDYTNGKHVSGCFVELIDNEGKIGPRFMYCAKQLVQVTPTVSTDRQSGVYFTRFDNIGHPTDQIQTSFMTFEEGQEHIGLYPTEEEAMSGGDPEMLARANDSRLKKELEHFRHVTEMEKIEAKRKETAMISELEELKGANAVLKEQLAAKQIIREEVQDHRKDYYEERSYIRKDNNDFMKFFPALVLGAVSIFAIFKK